MTNWKWVSLVAWSAAAYLPVLEAHTVNGSLAARRGASDLYTVSCSDDVGSGKSTEHLATQIVAKPAGAAPLVSVQTIKDSVATNTTDLRRDGTTLSQNVLNKGGNGTYYMVVNKAGVGRVRYQLEYHCESADDVHTGINENPLQNQ